MEVQVDGAGGSMEESGIMLVLCFCGIFSCTYLVGNGGHWSVLRRRTKARSGVWDHQSTGGHSRLGSGGVAQEKRSQKHKGPHPGPCDTFLPDLSRAQDSIFTSTAVQLLRPTGPSRAKLWSVCLEGGNQEWCKRLRPKFLAEPNPA